jgi:hypothetical protein
MSDCFARMWWCRMLHTSSTKERGRKTRTGIPKRMEDGQSKVR